MNIHQKLVEIRKDIGGFTKDKKSFNYQYVSGSQVLSKVQNKMNELGVLLIPSIIEQNFEKHEYTNSKGKQSLDFLVYGAMTYKWVNADKPEDFIEVPFYYTGAQDDISKAFGSGLTYSERYFIIKFFNLPTDADDPDARNTSGNSPYNKNNYQQNQNNYNNQPNQNYNQTNQQQVPISITEPQLKALKYKLNNVSKAKGADPQIIYNGALSQLGIAPVETKALTKELASKVINYLATLEGQ